MLIDKIKYNIDLYIKRFYFYKAFKGLLIYVLIIFVSLIFSIFFNYFFYFTVFFKTLVFWTIILFSIFFLIEFILIPFLKALKVLPTFTYKEATYKISDYYKDVQDKLLNIIELSEYSDNSLVLAAIKQKYDKIKLFSFSKAINFINLFKYLKYLLIPLFLLIIIFLFNNSILKQGFFKFKNYSVYYEKPAPFNFVLISNTLNLKEGDDYTVIVQLKGNYIPDEVFLNFGSNSIIMDKMSNSKDKFSYTFKSLSSNLNFYFSANAYKSDIYSLIVYPKPKILNFSIKVFPPLYTNKSSYVVNNNGDLIVPSGSKINYIFNTVSTDSLFFSSKSKYNYALKNKNSFFITTIANISTLYDIIVKNIYSKQVYFTYNLVVIPDLFPSISINFIQDSTTLSKYYYHGKIIDDYGFSSLNFNYKILNKNDKINLKNFTKVKINFIPNVSNQEFFYAYNFSDFNLSSEQILYYYFSVSDNDVLNHFKSSNTSLFNFTIPSTIQLDSILTNYNSKIEDNIQKANQFSSDIQKDIDDFNQKLLNENVSDWEKKEFIDNILSKQNTLKQYLDSLQNDNKNKIANLKNFNKDNSDLLQKQQQIQDLLNSLLTPEMKALIDELKSLNKNFDKKLFDKTLQKTNDNFNQLSQNLNRSKELLKRMQLEQLLDFKQQEFSKYSKDYSNISKSLNKTNSLSNELKDSIANLNFNVDNLISEYDSLLKFNNKLEKPLKLDSLNSLKKSLNQDLNNLNESTSKNKKNKSKNNSDKVSQDLKDMADKINNSLKSNNLSSKSEDIKTIKYLLSNILSFSFEQENIYNSTKLNLSVFSKSYLDNKFKQLNLISEYKIINDSLINLSKRNPSISKVLLDDNYSINLNLKSVINNYVTSEKNDILLKQRNILFSLNKIALLLNENLQNIKNSSSSGDGKSNSNSQNLSDIKSFQQNMKNNLKQIIQDIKSGKTPSSEQLGMQLAQREAFQQMLDNYFNNNNLSDDVKSLINETNNLNKQIKNDILNNTLNNETLLRENQITTKLLESEKANNKRKYSDKRISNTAKNIDHNVSPQMIDLLKSNKKFIEFFNTNNLFLSNFYKQYYNEYVIRIGN